MVYFSEKPGRIVLRPVRARPTWPGPLAKGAQRRGGRQENGDNLLKSLDLKKKRDLDFLPLDLDFLPPGLEFLRRRLEILPHFLEIVPAQSNAEPFHVYCRAFV